MANPSFIDKLWTITKVAFDPCDAPFTLEAKWLGDAALDLFLFFLNVDLMDVVTQGFRTRTAPYRTRSQRKGGRGSKAGRNPLASAGKGLLRMDPSELAGHSLADLEKPTPFTSAPGKALWILHGFLQRRLWQLFLANIIFDAFWQAMTMIQIYTFCDAADDTVLLVDGTDTTIIALVDWAPVPIPDIQKIRGDVVWNVASGVVGIPGAGIIAGCQCIPTNPVSFGAECALRLQVQKGDKIYTYDTADGILRAGQDTFLTVEAEIPFDCIFWLEVRLEAGAMRMHSTALSLQATPPK